MNYPRLLISKEKLRNNILQAKALCNRNNIEIVGVTKAFNSDLELVKLFIGSGIKTIADSRINNLKAIRNLDCIKMLLRVPMRSELDQVIKFADISVQSEITIIYELNELAKQNSLVHKIILFVEFGDLREGFNKTELLDLFPKLLNLKNIKIEGIGTNFTCYGGVIPDEKKNRELLDFVRLIENNYKIHIKIISGGNSSSIYLLINNSFFGEITQLRLGESILLGRETAFGKNIPNFYDDVFVVEAEIVELNVKPSVPNGLLGMNAFGEIRKFVDKGNISRALLAIGRKEIDESSIVPFDNKIEILDASSDYLIVDLNRCTSNYKIGDKIPFKLKYGSLVRIFSNNIERIYQ